MKTRVSARKKSRVNFKSNSFSLSNAKTYLGRLVAKAGKGETVFIVQGQRRFLLQEALPIEPIPMRPPGYFAGVYGQEDVQELNLLAKSSVVRPPSDIE
jgi:hypothetical protein